jgi:hippurate hydrolase
METLLKKAKGLQKDLVEIRRHLHKNAEIGFAVDKTLGYIQAELEDMGYAPQKCGKAGLYAEVGEGAACVLLRADIDGLPIVEKTGLPYACKNGNMHACGHDLHTTMLLGAAKLLKAAEGELNGRIRLLFQPAEELLQGAKDCMADGVLKGVQSAVMIHVLTAFNATMVRAIVSSEGVTAPAADYFKIEIKGNGCHGSAPWKGVDALTISARILLGLQELSAREISPASPAVLTIGSLQTGAAANVICDKAVLYGTLRSFDEETRAFVKIRMESIAKNTAKAFRGKAKISYEGGCPTLVNDKKLSSIAEKAAKKLLGERCVTTSQALGGDVRKNSGGSEDFAYISHAVPSVMIGLVAGESEKGYSYPLHHPKVKFDESVLPIGAALYAGIARELLSEEWWKK